MTQQIHRLRGMAYGEAKQKRWDRNEPFVIGNNMFPDTATRVCCVNCMHCKGKSAPFTTTPLRCEKHNRVTMPGWTCSDHKFRE